MAATFGSEVQSQAVCAIASSGLHGAAAKRLFGYASFNEETRSFTVCEYHEDQSLSRTEALLLQVQPRNCCMLLHDRDDGKKLRTVAESCSVAITEPKTEEMKQVDLEQDLLRLLSDTEGCGLGRHLEEQRLKQAMRALSVLIGHHNLLSEPSNFGACTLSLHPLKTLVHLDKAAFSALNILPRPEESLRANTSLYGFLNRCHSNIGTRRLRQWLTQPLTSPEEISGRHDVVEALCSSEDLLRQIEGSFRRVPDLERLAARMHRFTSKSQASKATLEDMVCLYQCVCSIEKMLVVLSTFQGVHHAKLHEMITHPLRECIKDFQGFKALIEQTVDLQQAEQRNYCISTAFDVSLGMLAQKRDQVRDQMEHVREAVEKELNLPRRGREKPVVLFECPDGQALRVTKKHQQAVQGHKGKTKIKSLSVKKQEFIFTIPELEKLNMQFTDAIEAYEKQSSQLVQKALTVGATYCPVVEKLNERLGSLDVLAAFSRVALTAPCSFVRAQIDVTGKKCSLKGANHILVVANSEKAFIANDLSMDRESSRLHLITGPNMGGKSTYIRSIALIALLNQIGSFVPCQEATLPLFDAIMCRVGASDMQLRGISTFMAEMLEASCILNLATEKSLVIVDELGRGTSTSDGFGIAWAIAKHLAEDIRCFSFFATHFHELADLEEAVPGVHNRHATANVDARSGQLTFLYSLVDGPADQSYGAHVAELAGFPKRVVDTSRKRALEFEKNGELCRLAKKGKVTTDVELPTALMGHIMAAADENDFVARAMEKLPALRAAMSATHCGGS